jgi:sarcosine oxidase subunit alpha
MANGVRVIARSFKFHRPRGFWAAWFDDPNAIFDISLNGITLPNCLATTTPLINGMEAKSVNAWPSAAFDIKGGLDLFNRFLSAGFYYKTFMWPDWHLFEPTIRKMAGLSAIDGMVIDDYRSDQLHDSCDLLVVGSGAAGLTAARIAAETGQNVFLVDDHEVAGGGLYRRGKPVDGQSPAEWVKAQISAINAAGGRVLLRTTAIGVYDHKLIALAQDCGFGNAPRLWRIRAARTIMATGALDRPLTFSNNDRPGIMSVDGALEFLGRYGVVAGQELALVSNNSFTSQAAKRLCKAGARLQIVDPQNGQLQALGGKKIHGLRVGKQKIRCDTILVSGGLTPVVHLWRHAGGKLDWHEGLSAFVPARPPNGMAAIGAANGTFDFELAIAEAKAVVLNRPVPESTTRYQITPHWPEPNSKGRQWIDFQHDVTLKDVELAARENYVSPEHLKRYTTLGMALDQGKTSNMAGLAAMAVIQNRPIPEVGTTTFRPPFVPVAMELYHGPQRGQNFHPLKRLPLETAHRKAGAVLCEYGGWLRPGWYGNAPLQEAVHKEVLMARKAAGIMDATPLGKIEVIGPDAEKFVNFIYYNTIKTLKTGSIRYSFMLTEGGAIYDDGVVTRLGQNRFLISCSSSHVDGVNNLLESWRQDCHEPDRIFIHNTTPNWPTITVSGPQARNIVDQLKLGLDLSADAFPHMTTQTGSLKGAPARVARVSFTGDCSFEISVPVTSISNLWEQLYAAANPLGAGPIGLEALSVLRAEKGFLIVGKDTDGETMPHDVGSDIPRQNKTPPFVGDRSLRCDVANDKSRKQLVGLSVPSGQEKIPTGAHLVTTDEIPKSIGFVTSSYDSPTLGYPIALALLENGHKMAGKDVTVWHMDKTRTVTVSAPCFFDQPGERLNASG